MRFVSYVVVVVVVVVLCRPMDALARATTPWIKHHDDDIGRPSDWFTIPSIPSIGCAMTLLVTDQKARGRLRARMDYTTTHDDDDE